jgi:hypothetical protein
MVGHMTWQWPCLLTWFAYAWLCMLTQFEAGAHCLLALQQAAAGPACLAFPQAQPYASPAPPVGIMHARTWPTPVAPCSAVCQCGKARAGQCM